MILRLKLPNFPFYVPTYLEKCNSNSHSNFVPTQHKAMHPPRLLWLDWQSRHVFTNEESVISHKYILQFQMKSCIIGTNVIFSNAYNFLVIFYFSDNWTTIVMLSIDFNPYFNDLNKSKITKNKILIYLALWHWWTILEWRNTAPLIDKKEY